MNCTPEQMERCQERWRKAHDSTCQAAINNLKYELGSALLRSLRPWHVYVYAGVLLAAVVWECVR